ncbi:MAG TPA: PEP-CTERM sorting domain-containing protein [Fimbriimonadaceae bacterium]|nr:PEP-CTERM sorting domain-containing protein [Fimbriimonadaceae bacterium]
MSHCKLIIFTLICVVSANRVANAQVVIDGFNPINHAHDFTFGSSEYVNRSFVRVFNGPMLGIERDVEYFQELPTNAAGTPQFFTRYQLFSDFNREYFAVGAAGPGASLGRARGYIEMQYDRNGDEVDNTGFDRHLRNGGTGQPFFIGDHYGVRIRNAAKGANPVEAVLTLRSQGIVLGAVTGVLGGTSTFRNEDFLFPMETMRTADSITLRLNLDAGGNSDRVIYLDRIETIVPEPSTLALFGMSGIFLLTLRRKPRT